MGICVPFVMLRFVMLWRTKAQKQKEDTKVFTVAQKENFHQQTKGDLFTGWRSWMRRPERKSNRNSTTLPDPVRLLVFLYLNSNINSNIYRPNNSEKNLNSTVLIFFYKIVRRFSVSQWPLFSFVKNTKSSCVWKANDSTDFVLNRGKNGFYFYLFV